MDTATIDRKGTVRRNQHIGRLLLHVSLCLGTLNFLWSFPKSAFATESGPTTTVLVYNQAHVSPGVLSTAEHEAGRILGAAGVRVIWLECPLVSITASPGGPCLRPLESTDIMLRVLPSPIQSYFKADVFGFAISPILASVYYDFAARLDLTVYTEFKTHIVLGCVIAHELGHLLLGTNSHSRAGIMQSPWGPKQVNRAMMGTLLFTAEQAKLMRASVRARSHHKGEFVETAEQQVDQQPCEVSSAEIGPATLSVVSGKVQRKRGLQDVFEGEQE
jgi:hypothetical protein